MRLTVGVVVALLVMIPRTSLAQTAAWYPDETRFLIDVNFGAADSLAKDREFRSRFVRFGEAGSATASYPTPSRGTTFVDIGGTFMVTRMYGFGISYSRNSYDDVAGLATTVPHPTFYAAPASHTGETSELSRTDGAWNFSLAVLPIRTSRLEWRIVVGPSIISHSADMVQEVSYVQTADPASPQQTVTISGVKTSEATATALGFHLGTDVAFYFSRMFGIGGGFRYSDGTATVDPEPLSTLSQDVRVGSTQFFGGLRFRVGG
jgi:hypothetical protein